MSKLTFNGKMKSCALQTGKTNKASRKLTPAERGVLSTFLRGGGGLLAGVPQKQETHFQCCSYTLPRNSLAFLSLKRLLSLFPYVK